MSALMVERRDWAEEPRQPSLFDALAPPPEREPAAEPAQVVEFPKRPESAEAESPFEAASEFELAAPPEAASVLDVAPETDTSPAVAGASAIEAEVVVTPEGYAGETRTPRAAGSPLARPTLDDVMSRVWEGLSTGLPAACPVCHGELEPTLSGPRQARCGSCGTTID